MMRIQHLGQDVYKRYQHDPAMRELEQVVVQLVTVFASCDSGLTAMP